jgi:DNA-binding MarR family transcriptional regulator
VERAPAVDDKRGSTVSLSSQGHEFATEVEERTFEALEPLLDGLPASDRDALGALLLRIVG